MYWKQWKYHLWDASHPMRSLLKIAFWQVVILAVIWLFI